MTTDGKELVRLAVESNAYKGSAAVLAPLLVDEIRRLRAEVERLTSERDEARSESVKRKREDIKHEHELEACQSFYDRFGKEPWFASVGIGTEGTARVMIVGVNADANHWRIPSSWHGFRVVAVDQAKLFGSSVGSTTEGRGEESPCG